jgi:hypothetical protein
VRQPDWRHKGQPSPWAPRESCAALSAFFSHSVLLLTTCANSAAMGPKGELRIETFTPALFTPYETCARAHHGQNGPPVIESLRTSCPPPYLASALFIACIMGTAGLQLLCPEAQVTIPPRGPKTLIQSDRCRPRSLRACSTANTPGSRSAPAHLTSLFYLGHGACCACSSSPARRCARFVCKNTREHIFACSSCPCPHACRTLPPRRSAPLAARVTWTPLMAPGWRSLRWRKSRNELPYWGAPLLADPRQACFAGRFFCSAKGCRLGVTPRQLQMACRLGLRSYL